MSIFSKKSLNNSLGAVYVCETIPVGNNFFIKDNLEYLMAMEPFSNLSFDFSSEFRALKIEGEETRENLELMYLKLSKVFRDSRIGKEWYFIGGIDIQSSLQKRNKYLQIEFKSKTSDKINHYLPENYMFQLDTISKRMKAVNLRFNSTMNRVYGFEELEIMQPKSYKHILNYIAYTKEINKFKFVSL